MDDKARKETFRKELRRRNQGRNVVKAKYAPKYPDSAEREYIRLVNAYMGIERQIFLDRSMNSRTSTSFCKYLV